MPGNLIDNAPSDELLKLAWGHAERVIDELQSELRLMGQRHEDAERQLLAHINQRKRLQQTVLDNIGQPTASA